MSQTDAGEITMTTENIIEETIEQSKESSTERYFKKVEESLQSKSVQIAIREISQYSDSLSSTKGAKSIEKLNKKHKDNLTILSESCIKDYVDSYGEIRENERWIFMESSYFVPGSGHATCVMMTQALPSVEDYVSVGDVGEIVTTQSHRAVREFYEEFGATSLHNLAFHTREAFFEKYALMIPYALTKLNDKPCDLTYKSKLHYNFP